MTNPKKATTYQEQVQILKQRACIIDDEAFCIEKLSSINYYRFSAYLLPYKEKDKYKNGTNFKTIYQIYEFDRKLRNIIYSGIELIEVSLRTRISYLHGHKYGALGYLDINHFNSHHKHEKFLENIKKFIAINRFLL